MRRLCCSHCSARPNEGPIEAVSGRWQCPSERQQWVESAGPDGERAVSGATHSGLTEPYDRIAFNCCRSNQRGEQG